LRRGTDQPAVNLLRVAYLRLVSQRGQTMAEYAILLAVIALVVILAAVFLGTSLSTIFSTTGAKV
jgi:Flp pilus assembly pilin Flp